MLTHFSDRISVSPPMNNAYTAYRTICQQTNLQSINSQTRQFAKYYIKSNYLIKIFRQILSEQIYQS